MSVKKNNKNISVMYDLMQIYVRIYMYININKYKLHC